MMIDQIAISILSGTSILLFSGKKHSHWGFIAGILGQPFWIHSTFSPHQWGVFGLSFVYTFLHGRGIYNNWDKFKR